MRLPHRRAKRSEAKPLVGLYGRSHSGKTKSALLLARGFVGPTGRIGMVETEGGRGEVYVDEIPGGYDVFPIRENYPPKDYGDAIDEAHQKNCDALIIDSGSHEWEGPGGVLALAAENESKGKKGMQVWLQPKLQHARHFLMKLQTTPIPLVILCMRAKQAMEEVTRDVLRRWEEEGHTDRAPRLGDWVRSKELTPIQSEDILSEMLVSGWIEQETHVYRPYASRVESLSAIFRDGEMLSIGTGEALARWAARAAGGAAAQPEPTPAEPPIEAPAAPQSTPRQYLSTEDVAAFAAKMRAAQPFAALKKLAGELADLSLKPADREILKGVYLECRAALGERPR